MARSRKGANVLESARRLFLERGFAGTTMEDVANDAQVSKATVYSNFRDKEALLMALMAQVSDEAAVIAAATLGPLSEEGDIQDRLERVAGALIAGVLRPEVLQLRRLAIAEGARFPDAARMYWEHAPSVTLTLLADAFTRMDDSGELHVGDARAAAEQFAYALLGPLQDRALLAPRNPPPATQTQAHARAVVHLFVEGAKGKRITGSDAATVAYRTA